MMRHQTLDSRSRRYTTLVAAAVAACAAIALAPVASSTTPASAQRVAESGDGALALEPIGGYTDLGNVRILTTALCPEQSTNIVARISGAGFPVDTNVIGNTGLDLVQRAPGFTGYVIPIFADWEYLASAHEAKLPLDGRATLAVLCADADLQRIDARMEGAVDFASSAGKKSTYLQEGGPRIASGLPGIPPPGNGGVPKDAPTAAAVTTTGVDQPSGQISQGQATPGGTSDVKSGGTSAPAGDANDLTTAAAKDGGAPSGLLLAIGLGVALLAFGSYVFLRRPGSDDSASF